MAAKKKEMTAKQIDSLTDKQLEQLVMVTNDGQGDTNLWNMYEYKGWEEDWEKMSNSDLLRMIWKDTNANMTTFIWIENNTFYKVSFIDL